MLGSREVRGSMEKQSWRLCWLWYLAKHSPGELPPPRHFLPWSSPRLATAIIYECT